ncbi:GntR family transcriptional regulator [Alicyclobacillus curvatus]|jgi:DNA-binding GntR family transcriptional regulator|nr:GntR family transcriptional regulator [Alicyclobacillus curvatus]
MKLKPKPIQRAEPLSEQVYRYVREAILSGQLAPGEKIVETKLANELQVSRSPVREAMQLLYTEQLVVEQDGAMCVFQPSTGDLYDLYDLRLAVEPAATRKAAELCGIKAALHRDRTIHGHHRARMDAITDHLLLLEANLDDTRRCLEDKDMKKLLRLNSQFHQTIWEMSGNTRFIRILENASDLIQYYCLLVLDINNQQTNILKEHTEIYGAIREGDADRAALAMVEHINKDLDVIRNQALLSS